MALSYKLQLVYYFIIALTGLIGNTTTIIVFAQRRLRSLRSSFFLTCLAVTDLVFIFILIVALLDELDAPVMTVPVCMLTIYLSHIASFLSSNFTLAYTTHRLIAVLFPIKATTFLKQRTNRILALTLLIFACVFYSLSFSVTTTKSRTNSTNIVHCEEDRNKPLLFPFLVLDTLFTFIIPFSSISVMNLTIVYKLQTKLTYKHQLSTSGSPTPIVNTSTKSSSNSSGSSLTENIQISQVNNDNGINNNNNAIANESHRLLRHQNRSFLCVRPIQRYRRINNRLAPYHPRQKHTSLYHKNTSIHIRSTQCRGTASTKTTKMLLAASTVFLVFNLPYHLLLFCFLFIKTQPSWMLDAVNIARLWFFASFCVNFFVYAICGQRFRNEVVRLFCCSFNQRCIETYNQKKLRERQNSIYLSHRLLPISSSRYSHSN
ncbi:unnamed protein product [Rotaria sp. Silwood2]|nr:unnamed protein product [Rotaria sp. Silwood2]CAF2760492.1 unnamed protein product [Rotaria sp. Silwood2]CAF3007401.1 unnamed protein product [Rotaria sp. Silwood2]CAF3149335.1 unnamed protein product [Rotaria sp. Silwood2]CAF3877162.1 unnamed protein product [Rotaria sp. Silwood2]